MSVVSKSLAEQHEVDGVAFFVEAATQLARSKFYIEEHINLGFSGISKDGQFVLTGLTFPAPEVRDSILFPFRRIWMEEEPCFFFKVLNTLKRYAVHWQERLDSFHAIHSEGLKQFMCPFALRFSTLSPRDVINLWLNTRFAHVSSSVTKGKRSIFTKGKPSSSDFAKHEQMIGAPQFEYLFYNALLNLGFDYIHLLDFANDILQNQWMQEGLLPSFRIASRPTDIRSSHNDIIVVRSTPGVETVPSSPLDSFRLLLRRQSFTALNNVVRMLLRHDASAELRFIESSAPSVWLHSMGLSVDHSDEKITHLSPDWIGFTDLWERRSLWEQRFERRGSIAQRSANEVTCFGHAGVILAEQFQSMKKAIAVYDTEQNSPSAV